MKKRFYQLAENIEGSEPLVQFANTVLRKTEMLRIISAPSCTTQYMTIQPEAIHSFYQCCLIETYLHSAIEHLRRWKADAQKYNNEFQCSWKYYAIAERLDCIKQYGGEEDDYNEDGSIRMNPTDGELKTYSLISSWTGYNDIFLTSKTTDFDYILTAIQNEGKFSLTNMFRELGKPLTSYKIDKNGNLVANDWADEQLDSAKRQFVADELSVLLIQFVENCRVIIDEIEQLKPDKDNKEFFNVLPSRIDAIFNLKLNSNESHKILPQ